MNWSPLVAAGLAESALASTEDRWLHTRSVARFALELQARTGDVSAAVVAAAWLHDVGYGPEMVDTGFHPLDGASWLRIQGIPEGIVALVAYHSGAIFEAEERGLLVALADFTEPDPDQLDMLTLVDMAVGPTGERVSVKSRLDEILSRYPADHPVNRAVKRSRPSLIESAERAAMKLGLADVRTHAPV